MNSLARARINWASVAHERTKRLPDVVADHEIGKLVLLGGLVVDNDQLGAAVLGQHRKTCGRPDHQRRSDRKEQVAMLGALRGAAHGLIRHRLPERDGGGFVRLLADGSSWRAPSFQTLFNPRPILAPSPHPPP